MTELCSSKVSPKQFRERINDYFKYDDIAVLFEDIVFNPFKPEKWFRILQKKDKQTDVNDLINDKEARSRLSSLARYLESYANITGFNYLSGILRLICSDYEGTEGERRLTEAFKNITEKNDKSFNNTVFTKTLEIATKLGTYEQNVISQVLLDYYPERALEIHEILNNACTTAFFIKKAIKRIQKIWEVNINGSRL